MVGAEARLPIGWFSVIGAAPDVTQAGVSRPGHLRDGFIVACVGTDISFFAEHRDLSGWRRVEELEVDACGKVRCLRCQEMCVAYADAWVHESNAAQLCPPGATELGVPVRRSWFTARSYTLFGVLTGRFTARHPGFPDHGHSGYRLTPVAEVRGLPTDVSDEVRFHAQAEPDSHTHSYLTVGELLGYDWNQVTHHEGVVDYQPRGAGNRGTTDQDRREAVRREQARLDRHGGPPRYPFEVRWRNPHPAPDSVRLVWTEPLWRDVPASFLGALLRMSYLAAGDLDSVRCVFWFDS